MSVRFHAAAIVLAGILVPVQAQTTPKALPPVVVTANGIPVSDADATYASEVYDRAAIEMSGATTLYDFLAQHTSLTVMPAFGNKAAPLVNMRGYGLETGHQNMVFEVDGRRMNNIDSAPPAIGMFPLAAIESIEISKGAGSVRYGDGAMAGVISIRTRKQSGISIGMQGGNHDFAAGAIAAGFSEELFDVSFIATRSAFGGVAEADPTGHGDTVDTHSEQGSVTFRPIAGLSLFVQGSDNFTDTRYPNPMTLAQFEENPRQYVAPSFPPNQYQHQILETQARSFGGEYKIHESFSIAYVRGDEDMESRFSGWGYLYDAISDDLSFKYRGTNTDIVAGMQRYKGERASSGNVTTKENKGVFLQAQHRLDLLTLTAGFRTEDIDYSHQSGGTGLAADERLQAWDMGANYRFSEQVAVFANFNHAYQAPDIDRFFTFDFATGNYVFNGFIEPARTRNFTLGLNHDTSRNQLRAAVFYSRLRDEIYFQATGPFTGFNTNIDKSHKYGLELRDVLSVRHDLQLSLTYGYTKAVIDSASQGAGAYDGKDLPGVPPHALTLGLVWQAWAGAMLNLNHVWRDSSYSMGDFENNREQRQAAYRSTNLSLRQRWGKLEGMISIDNLFEHKNGIWTGDDAIYPVDYSRMIRLGLKAEI